MLSRNPGVIKKRIINKIEELDIDYMENWDEIREWMWYKFSEQAGSTVKLWTNWWHQEGKMVAPGLKWKISKDLKRRKTIWDGKNKEQEIAGFRELYRHGEMCS